jgi:hypothetical protein
VSRVIMAASLLHGSRSSVSQLNDSSVNRARLEGP